MNPDLLSEAKRRLPLSALMAQLGHSDHAKKSARCPFHEDSSASFSVFPGNDGELRWKCFAGCGQGDAIDFLALARNLSNADACREFIRLSGVTPSPAPRPQSSTAKSQPAFDWPALVAAFTPEHAARLAEWRGYSPEFVSWLHAQSLVGIFGERIAFPVHEDEGAIVACHYRRKEDGSWRYDPAGKGTHPLVIGDARTTGVVWAFESQWDAFALMDRLGWHLSNGLPDTGVVITRGAENGKLIAGLCAPSSTVYAFAQNDPPRADGKPAPADKWLSEIAAHCGCNCVHVVTPPQFKDLNDWTRAGASAVDLRDAIASAQPLPAPSPAAHSESVDLHAPGPSVVNLPADDDDAPPTPFPVELLPAPMGGIVAAVARCERVPLALPGVCALGVVSAAIGAGLEVVSGPNRITRANLFLLASAESGSGKSETFRIVAAPLVEHQARLLDEWRDKTSPELQSEIAVLKREAARLEKKAASAPDQSERERLRGELQYRLALIEDRNRKAAMPCLVAQDVTTERLAVLLERNREVMFSASADARKLVDNLLGRYNPGKTTDESLYLSAFSGDFVRVDRQGREPVVLHKPCLSLCWFIQPDLLAMMLDEQSLSASGYLPRNLLCHTQATARRIEGEVLALSDRIRAAWTQLVADLLAAFHAADKSHRIEPAPEAKQRLDAFHNSIVDRRNGGDLADVGAFAARYAEQAWRVAVVLHAAAHGADAANHPLALETADNTVRLVEWFIARQLEILARGRRQSAQKQEDEVLELLDEQKRRKGVDYIAARDVHRARIVPAADAALALLLRMEQDGILTGQDVRPPHGGKTTRHFRAVAGRNPVPE